jgi:hypothetical protein
LIGLTSVTCQPLRPKLSRRTVLKETVMGPTYIATSARRSVLLLAVAAAALLLPSLPSAMAQSDDTVMSCAPEAVRAGETTTCSVAGVAPSSRTTVELRSGDSVVGRSSAISTTAGRASIEVAIPADAVPGELTLSLGGTALTFVVTVVAGLPTGVSAGVSPSVGDIERAAPLALLLALATTMAAVALRRRRELQS